MNYDNYTDEELIREVDNNPQASALERLLADRLVSVKQAINDTLEKLKGVKHGSPEQQHQANLF